jgi:hypothetical protein
MITALSKSKIEAVDPSMNAKAEILSVKEFFWNRVKK